MIWAGYQKLVLLSYLMKYNNYVLKDIIFLTYIITTMCEINIY